ncbi:MAG TPA: TadE family type IV pilus minor pilin [Galbitalea sp.]
MTAEFAMALPAVVVVLVVAMAAMSLVGEQVRLQGAVAGAARLLGRGDPGAAALVEGAAAGGRLTIVRRGDLVCADAQAPGGLGPLLSITITSSSCALDDAL